MYILIPLLLFGTILRVHQLDRALGGGDENQALLEWVYTPMNYILAPSGDPHSWDWSLGYGFDQIFSNIVLRIMVLLFGEENALAIRFPAFVAGIACIWMVYKLARQIYPSKAVARLALLTISVCPIHIYYSQTARGYSFIMFFSTLSIYATLKLLKSNKNLIWGLLLFLSGILSLYTIPLTAVFILSLAVWILLVLTIPTLKVEFGLDQESVSRKFYQFLSIFILMGIGSLLLYWPHIDGLIQMLNEYYDDSEVGSSNWGKNIYSSYLDKLIYFIPNLLTKIFPGLLIYFTPFILIGIFWNKTYCLAYRLLPVVILLATYLFTLITGLAYYPRGYLFNLPLLLIFLVGGIMWTGENLGNLIKQKTPINWIGYSLIGAYAVLALTEIFLNYYPSIKTFNVKDYTKKLSSQMQKNDLLLVADSKFYLYARSIYKKNLQNIIADNQLGGISLLVNNAVNIEDYYIKTPKGYLPVFFNWQDKHNFKSVSNDKKLIHLNNIKSTSLLSKDFESTVGWKVQSGAGEFASTKDHKFTGEKSLSIKAFPKKNLVLQRMIGQVKLNQPHLVVLAWSAKKFSSGDSYFLPALGISSMTNGKKEYGQIALGKINEGMSIYIKEKTSNEKPYYWEIDSAIGLLPAGEFSLNLLLNCEAGKSILYDSLGLFLINHSLQSEEKIFSKEKL